MKRFILAFGLMNVMAGLCLAEDSPAGQKRLGVLEPVPVEAGEQAIRAGDRCLGNVECTSAPKDCGTVNAKAVVFSFKAGDHLIKAAVDSAQPDDKQPAVLRLDFSGQGQFADAPVVPLKAFEAGPPDGGSDAGFNATFGPTTVAAKLDGRTIPVQVKGFYYHRSDNRHVHIGLSTANEALCRLGDKTVRVRVLDGNNNLKLGDPTRILGKADRPGSLETGDTLFIYPEQPGPFLVRTFMGQPVCVEGKWYEVALSADSATVTVKPVVVATGQVQVKYGDWSAFLVGRRFAHELKGDTKSLTLPEDEYTIVDATIAIGSGEQATKVSLASSRKTGEKAPTFAVKAGQTTELAIGEPLVASVVGEPEESGSLVLNDPGSQPAPVKVLRLNLDLRDAAGLQVINLDLPGGNRPAEPVVELFEADGKSVFKTKLEYG